MPPSSALGKITHGPKIAPQVSPNIVVKTLGPQGTAEAIASQLYHLRQQAKGAVRHLYWHLPPTVRDTIFPQIDALIVVEDWEEGDAVPRPDSFATFLSAMIILAPVSPPGLALTRHGHIVASWGTKNDYLSIEFLGANGAKFSLRSNVQDKPVRSATECPIEQIEAVLTPYHPRHWWHPPHEG